MPVSALAILHVDMDAFYAAVEQRDRPELRGQPVIVGGIQGRGVVSAASYEARRFGVRSAMPMTTARRLCPQGHFLPVRMKHYAEVSRQIREIFFSFTPLVEPLSLDEAFLDVHGCEGLFGPAPDIARQIKIRIKEATGLIASVGVAPNKFLAKLACDVGKPDGLVILPEDKVMEFLSPLPVGRLWGVGAKGEKRLHDLTILTIGQLAATPEKLLIDHFGEMGAHIWRLAHGEDDRSVVPDREAKSISAETTFAQDIADRHVLRVVLLELVDQVAGRLRQSGLRAQTIDLKLRSSDFRTRTRSQALAAPTNSTDSLWKAAVDLFKRALAEEILPLRLLGAGVTRLSAAGAVQRGLFDEELDRQHALDHTVDAIRGKFGTSAIHRGSSLEHGRANGGGRREV
jgi:DNA polymerase-4